MVFSDSPDGDSSGVASMHKADRTHTSQVANTSNEYCRHQDPQRRLSLVSSSDADIRFAGKRTSFSSQNLRQHQTIGLRTKKYLIPRLLSHRKVALATLHPLSAAVMNDMHYLLKAKIFFLNLWLGYEKTDFVEWKSSLFKAHITPKAHFQNVDHVILRTMIKVGIIAQRLMDDKEAVAQMRQIECLSRKFASVFSNLVNTAENAGTSSSCLDVSMVPDVLSRLQEALNNLIEGRLSEKSITQMNSVFEELQDIELWQAVFDYSSSGSEDWQLARNLRDSFNELLKAKLL
ncbi:unnamed protein product [Mesocestoides corti]|uniref:Uncharacterized protein n=1 Tax=Mesocestoides corti TaxID=53468 RepID=A0A0R3ULP1_MESCO|nr:unnamed protein product [Mesocestoides corti]